MGNNPKVIDLRILLTISKWIFNDNFLQCPNLRMFNDKLSLTMLTISMGSRLLKQKYVFAILLNLFTKIWRINCTYVRGKCFTIVWKIVAVMCKHFPALGGNHLTAGDIWSNRRQFSEQAARKCGNFWSKRREKAICFGKYWTPIDFQLLIQRAHQVFRWYKAILVHANIWDSTIVLCSRLSLSSTHPLIFVKKKKFDLFRFLLPPQRNRR